MMNNQKIKTLFNWLAVLIWLGVIYYFSNQPDLKSELEPFWDLIFRKIAHMAEYFVLAFLFFNTFQGHKILVKKSLVLAFLAAFIYAIFDEYHQTFVFGRSGSIVDVGVDGVGIIAFIGLMLVQQLKSRNM